MIVLLVGILTLILGFPVVFVLGITSLTYLIINDISLLLAPQRFFVGLDAFVLLAIPFYILMGNLMRKGEVTDRLIHWAQAVVGHIRGGLAHVNILVSIIFAGISGSASADTSAIGNVLIPAMHKEGYDKDFATAVTVASSGISPIIPPSIIMVVYAVVAEVSIGKMFIAGFVPGLLMGLGQMFMAGYISTKRQYPKRAQRTSLKEFLKATRDAFLALIAPGIILVGILGGIFTPTEAGVIAAAYALFLGLVCYRTLKLKDLPGIFWETALLSSGAYLLVGMSAISAWIISAENVPQTIASFILSITSNKMGILLLLNLLFLVTGMFVEAIAAIIILTPIFLPVVTLLGVDPIHFGVIICVNLVIGFVTPPVGASLFIASGIAKLPLAKIFRAVLPFIIVNIAILLLITFVPQLVMWLPNLLW